MTRLTLQVRGRAFIRPLRTLGRGAVVIALLSILSEAAPAQDGGAGGLADQSRSFEAALKAYCPTKNLEFLDPPLLARSIREYVQMLPEEQRDRIIKASSDTISGCAKDDISCAVRSGLAALRSERLADDLARLMCGLPYTCRDWSQCDKPANTASLPELGQPSAPGVTDPGPPVAREAPAPPSPEGDRLAEGERSQESTGEVIERAPRPASPRDAVIGFYEALRRGDGIAAEWYVIREKRGTGPFMASSMERFYGGLSEPLRILEVEEVGPLEFRVRYRFTPRRGPVCNGTSYVRVRSTAEGYRVAGIEAPSGC